MSLLLFILLSLAGYWAWSGRPRTVESVPQVLATGSFASSTPGAPAVGSATVNTVADPSASPATTPVTVVVHVVGRVRHPGVVELPAGSRVGDAVDAAGGVTRPAAASSVNLARVLLDGEQIVVGDDSTSVAAAPAPAAEVPGSSAVVNLNSADAGALESLPGVGPVIAQRIVDWRAQNGPFRSIDELGEVSGIGDSILSQVRGHVGL
jgi:competence protein ComEA